MDRSQCRVGMQVIFGRENGEKTLGEVVKINPKKAKVRILESRGSHSMAGAVWGVPYAMMWLPGESATPKAPVVREPLKYSPFQDAAEVCILEAIDCVYGELSPENLAADGELPFHVVQQKSRRYNAMLRHLFAALGREVTEMEVYEWTKSRKVAIRHNS